MKAEFCPRCESIGRESHKNATNPVIFNKIDTLVCDECLNEINNEYEKLERKLNQERIEADQKKENEKYRKYGEKTVDDLSDDFRDIINALMKFSNINVDLVGDWIWVDGETLKIKSELKQLGLMWAAKKKKWYWRPEYAKVIGNSKMTYDEITAKYGVDRIKVVHQLQSA